MREVLKAGLETALHYSGAAGAFARLRGVRGATIVMYHSVARRPDANWIDPPNRLPPKQFEAHLRYLKRYRRPVSLDEMVRRLREERPCPRGSVVLTFDDGYLDNLRIAAPLLERYRIPAILYLPTAYIDRSENQWADVVHTAVRARTRDQFALGEQLFDLDTQEDEARRALHVRLLPASAEARRAILDDLVAQLAPDREAPRLTMNWDEIRELVERYPRVAIGAHTVEHLDLSTHTESVARRELVQSRKRIEEELGRPVRHLSFPYGRAAASVIDLVRSCGYETALISSDEPLVAPGANLAALPRIVAPGPVSHLALWTSGGYPYLRQALLGGG